MRYLIVVFSLLSIAIGQYTKSVERYHEPVQSVDEYDTEGRITQSYILTNEDRIAHQEEISDSKLDKIYKEAVEMIYEYDTDGRITATRMISKNEFNESLDDTQVVHSDVFDEPRVEYQYDDNGRVVNK